MNHRQKMRRRAKTREERASALTGDDLAEAADEALVVLDRVKLDARLDDVDGRERAVGDRAANAAGECTGEIVLDVEGTLAHDLAIAGRGLRGGRRRLEGTEEAKAGVHTRETEERHNKNCTRRGVGATVVLSGLINRHWR